MKRGIVDENLAQKAISLMSQLNRAASEAMVEVGANACTDVTGFGLLGHLKELTLASGVEAEIWLDQVPILPGAWDLVAIGAIPGGTQANLEFLADWVEWDEDVPYSGRILLCDAQTSGGLIISVASAKREMLLRFLGKKGVKEAVEIGRISGRGKGRIKVKGRMND
jgi:selenide,water dikinase